MTRLKWGDAPPGYDLGLDRGVLYLDGTAAPWNGLVAVAEKDTGEMSGDYYFDGVRLHVSHETGAYEAAISAFTYPDAFSEYNGYSEDTSRKRFGFSYRTMHGEDHRLHLVYNVLVRDTSRAWRTTSAQLDPSLFNWDIYAEEVEIPGASPASHLIMEVPRDSDVFGTIEDILYGTDTTEPRLPLPEELVEIYESTTQLRITYNGDGTYTATGPDSMVQVLSDGRFALSAPTIFETSDGRFVANSY